MGQASCEALIVEHPVMLFYLTGLRLSAGLLLISKSQEILFVDGRYLLKCQKESALPVKSLGEEEAILSKSQSVAFDGQATSYARYRALQEKYPLTPVDLSDVRMVKDPYEIACIKKSTALMKQGFAYIATCLKPGVTEKTLAWEFEKFCREKGADGLAFDPIIAFGAGSAEPHHETGNTKLKTNDWVLIDAGVKYRGYCSDRTRTFAIGQKVSKELQKIREITIRAQKATIAMCHPGTSIRALNTAANQIIENAGYLSYFPHSLGHSLGLEIHEYPYLRQQGVQELMLEAGMIITIEPGIYLPGLGGVRHEDMVLIREQGHQVL